MNRKMLTHGLKITAIIIVAFVAASLTPARSFAKTAETSAVAAVSIDAKENAPLRSEARMIADNDVPLAAAPYETETNMTFGWIIIAAAALMTGIVIFEDFKDRRSI